MLSNDVLMFQISSFYNQTPKSMANMKMKSLKYNISVCMKNEPQNDS